MCNGWSMYNKYIKELKEALDIKTPVDLDEFVSKFKDVDIIYGVPNEYEDIAHSYIIEGVYTIKVRDSKLTDDNKYWIAVELGHIFLNHLDKSLKLYNEYHNEWEYEAEEFARELLMSEDEFRKVVYENSEDGVCDLIAVGNHFKVDSEIVLVKGKFLRLFPF